MKTRNPGAVKFPLIYRSFKNSQEIADTINRSPSYVKKALKCGFTTREISLLEQKAGRRLIENV